MRINLISRLNQALCQLDKLNMVEDAADLIRIEEAHFSGAAFFLSILLLRLFVRKWLEAITQPDGVESTRLGNGLIH